MANNIKNVFLMVSLSILIAIVFVDSRIHIDADLISKKRNRHAAFEHWYLGLDQSYLYINSSLRYEADFMQMSSIIQPGFVALSDWATSYYLAAYLPVYVRNINLHHGRYATTNTSNLLNNHHLCKVYFKANINTINDFFKNEIYSAKSYNLPVLRYIVINKDKQNLLLKKDCLAVNSEQLESNLLKISKILYEGEFLNLYEIDYFNTYN